MKSIDVLVSSYLKSQKRLQFKNASAFLPRRARRVSAFHCARLRSAGGFILHREIVLTMKASFTLRAYLTTKVASIAR